MPKLKRSRGTSVITRTGYVLTSHCFSMFHRCNNVPLVGNAFDKASADCRVPHGDIRRAIGCVMRLLSRTTTMLP